MQTSDGAHQPALVWVDSLADLGRLLLKGEARNLIAVSRSPDPSLCDALIEENAPFLLLLEEPAVSVAILVEEQGVAPAEAVRWVANAHTATIGLARASNALVVRRDDLS